MFDVYVLLDALLLILIALFIPIGFWRGAYREAFVTLGVLFGASLGTFWGETWGVELADLTRLHESGGAFMVAMLCLISSTFLLGYSAGAAVPVPEPGWVARALGALVAAANGALLLSFALRDIRIYLLSSDDAGFLDNAIVAPFLSEGSGWILLVGGAFFVPIALVLALFGPDVEVDEYYESDDFEPYDDSDYEPYDSRSFQVNQRQFDYVPPEPQPAPSAAEATRPLPTVDDGDESPYSTPGGGRHNDPEETPREPYGAFGHHSEDSSEYDEDPYSTVSMTNGRCPNCRAPVGEEDDYCPSCGQLV